MGYFEKLMHYKNGRQAKLGDLIVGKTHNSRGHLRIGKVQELMDKQGPCNVRLLVIGMATGVMVGPEDDRTEAHRFFSGEILRGSLYPYAVEICEDFADCKELLTVVDAYRALNAIESYSRHDSPYFPDPLLDF